MQKSVKIRNFYSSSFLILKIHSFNKNTVNSILKKFLSSYFINFKIFKNYVYVSIKIDIFLFEYEKNKVLEYLKKENLYFSVLGVKNKNNYLNYNFFIKNFVHERLLHTKFLIFNFYFRILNYYTILLKFYFIVNYLFYSILNSFFYFKCLHLSKQLRN